MSIFSYLEEMLQNKLAKETFWSFAAKGVAFPLFFLINVYLARALGVEKFGMWSFFLSILTIILLLSYFGINASTKKFVAQYNKTDELYNVIKSAIRLRITFSLAFAVLMVFIHKPLADLVGKPELATLFFYSIPLVVLSGFVEFLKNIFMGLHQMKYNFIVNTLEFGLKFSLVVVFVSISAELLNIVYSYSIAVLATSAAGFLIVFTKFYKKPRIVDNKVFRKEIFRYSLPLFFISIGFLLVTEIDILMIGLMSTDKEVGIYSVAKQIIIKLPQLTLAIALGTMPIFAKLNAQNKERLEQLFYRLLRINALIYSIISTFIIALSWYFIPFIFGDDYIASVLPLQILTVFLICASFAVYINSFLDYQGLAKKRAIYLSVFMLLNICLNLVLIPIYGATGAAMATSISFLPYVFLSWFEVKRVLNRI